MEKRLKQCLGIDVSKLSLSLSLGILNQKLVKKFEKHIDVKNDLSGFKTILKWLRIVVDINVDFLIVLEATGVYHQGISHYLYEQGFAVSVMQSGRVKRYAPKLRSTFKNRCTGQ